MSMDIFRADALAGKTILVTGGGSGLGKEISKALVAKGAAVHICGRRAQLLDEAVREISASGSAPVRAHTCDIRDAEQVEAMMNAIWATGPLTGLINNAAANFISPTKDLSPRGFRAVTSTVMDGSFHVTLAAGKRWIAGGLKGSVVSNLVTWVWSGSAFVVPSAMAKTALHAMTMSLVIVFLLSDACDYLTGQTIAIDGGQHLAGPGTFADLGALTDEQWRVAREAIQQSTQREKTQRVPG